MTLSIHHIAINAQAPDEMAALYGEAVDFKRVATQGSVRWLAGPNAFIALHQATRGLNTDTLTRSVADQGIGHFCIQSGDGPGTWRALSAAGIGFNAEMTSLGGDYLYAYGRDPEANLIEGEGMTVDAEPGSPWIAHVALVSADLERLADFYVRLIGRASHNGGRFKHPSFKAITGHDDVDVSAKWLMADNIIFEMWQYHEPLTRPAKPPLRGAPGYRHIGFCCDDLDAERARLARAGVNVAEVSGALGMPTLGTTDPDGNRIIIMQSPPAGSSLSLKCLPRPNIVADRHRDVLGL
jgi:catechol 2,3-dioxygenase-like lactoylglutathione lyase family enzyme